MTPQSKVRAVPGLLSSPVGDEVALLHLEQGRYYGLSPTAAALWPRLQEPVSAGELVTQMLDSYKVDETTAQSDLTALLQELLKLGLIEEVADAAAPSEGSQH